MAIDTELDMPTIVAQSRSNKDELISAFLLVPTIIYIFSPSEKFDNFLKFKPSEFTIIPKIFLH